MRLCQLLHTHWANSCSRNHRITSTRAACARWLAAPSNQHRPSPRKQARELGVEASNGNCSIATDWGLSRLTIGGVGEPWYGGERGAQHRRGEEEARQRRRRHSDASAAQRAPSPPKIQRRRRSPRNPDQIERSAHEIADDANRNVLELSQNPPRSRACSRRRRSPRSARPRPSPDRAEQSARELEEPTGWGGGSNLPERPAGEATGIREEGLGFFKSLGGFSLWEGRSMGWGGGEGGHVRGAWEAVTAAGNGGENEELFWGAAKFFRNQKHLYLNNLVSRSDFEKQKLQNLENQRKVKGLFFLV